MSSLKRVFIIADDDIFASRRGFRGNIQIQDIPIGTRGSVGRRPGLREKAVNVLVCGHARGEQFCVQVGELFALLVDFFLGAVQISYGPEKVFRDTSDYLKFPLVFSLAFAKVRRYAPYVGVHFHRRSVHRILLCQRAVG